MSFPLTPHYIEPEPVVTVNKRVFESLRKADAIQNTTTVLNEAFKETFKSTFVETMVKHGQQRVQVKFLHGKI